MILVVGSTGLVGSMITRSLLEQGQKLRILVRPGSDHQSFIAAGAEPTFGDLKDAASLARAVQDADVVITTASAGQRGGEDTPQTVDLEGNRNLIDAARAAGTRQFIFVSALTAREDSPVALPRAKAQTETYLRNSGAGYTIIAANGIMDVMLPLIIDAPIAAGVPVTLVGEGKRRHSLIAARDVASFTVAAVDHAAAMNQRIEVGGPEAFSWRDAVGVYARALGRDIPIRSIRPGELLPHLPSGLTELVSGLLATLETFDSPVEMRETAQRFSVRLTSLEEFVNQKVLRMPITAAPFVQST
jgi:NADH dehydrogenase